MTLSGSAGVAPQHNLRILSTVGKLVAVAMLVFGLFVAEAFGQISGTGSIQGTVADSSGAVVPHVKVTITEDATQVQHTVTTNGEGFYNFPNTSIGTYTLTVAAQGFQGYKQPGIVLDVASSIKINVSMVVGSEGQTVEVQAAGVTLQTEDATFKQTIDQRTITELPLNGRQITSLITLAGASTPSTGLTQGNKGFFSSVSPQIAGGQGNQSDYRLDGGDNNDYSSNTSFAFPFPDAVAQFTVETSALGAQSGLHPAGVINVVTRSGSNQWHGAAFDFIRNNYINATNYFSTIKDQLHQHQFGGTLGGKILRDKLFFFAGYQRLVSSSASASTTATVPTAANLLGDFSAQETAPCNTVQVGGKPGAIQLYNPTTGALLPNDVINPSFFNATSLAIMKGLPQAENACGTVHFSIPVLQTENQFITRIDSTINAKHSLYGRYFVDGYVTPAFFNPSNLLTTGNPGNTERAQTLTVGETWVASSKFVNSLHLTATRRTNSRGPADQGVNATTYGIDAYQPVDKGFRLQGAGFTLYCSTCATGIFNVNSFSVIDDVNYVLGKHQITFGGEFIRAQLNVNNAFTSNGTFNFSNVFSQKGPAQTITSVPAGDAVNGLPATTGGQSLLDFLTGSMTSFSQSKPQQNSLRAPIPSLYVQDTYHLTERFVVSAGVRWSGQFTPYDYFGRGSTFDMKAFVANQHSARFPNAPAGAFFYGDAGVTKNFTSNYLAQFSPRLGLTFDPFGKGKTVFRAGASLIYDESNFFAATQTGFNPPFSTLVQNTATNAPINITHPWVGGNSPGNPFPQPFTPPTNQTFSAGTQWIVYPKDYPTPYVAQWTASMQQDFGKGWQLQLYYIGNKATHSVFGAPLNPVVYIPGTYTGVAGSCGNIAVAPKVGTACSTTGNSQSRSVLQMINPTQGAFYSGGGNASTLLVPGATARYDGLVTTIQHRATSTFTFLLNHTWSHCFDVLDNPGSVNTVQLQNPNNPKGDYSACGFDRRHIVNVAIVATSHFASLKGWKGYAVNDWQIAPIMRVTSGAPFNVTSGIDNSFTAIGQDRPNWTGADPYIRGIRPSPDTTKNQSTLDIAQFSVNAVGTYGNLKRNAFVGPKSFTLDSALSRTFPLHDRLALQLRLEAFNVLNHPVFNNPSASVNSPGSFGKITGASSPRIFQVAAKVTF
jgi:hypothetical protein